MRPLPAALCDGQVFHRRLTPVGHSFRQDVSYVWLDPDRPEELCRNHLLWSSRRPAPVRFRPDDYGDDSELRLSEQVRRDLDQATGHRPSGPVRMLTQLRRWGWLFNPITVYVAWDDDPDRPVGAVLEVTNTPWKERHRYAVELTPPGAGERAFTARFPKQLHVSPFLGERYDYLLELAADDTAVELAIDVVEPGSSEPVVVTRLRTERTTPSRANLGANLRRRGLPTHRVSLGIHVQAAKLAGKRVPFVAHPRSRSAAGAGREASR